MFFIKWIAGLIISLILNAGVFALIEYFSPGTLTEPAAVAALASFLASAVFLIILFPAPKKRKK